MSRQHDPPHSFAVDPQTPSRELRHQSSLEHAFNFTLETPKPSPQDAENAHFLFNEIINDCESASLYIPANGPDPDDDYIDEDRKVYLHNLFRALVEFCPKPDASTNIVRMILHGLFLSDKITTEDRTLSSILPIARSWLTATDDKRQPTFRMLETIASDFLHGFFVPLVAQSTCTPHVSGLLSPPTPQTTGTHTRLRTLRETCLIRDGHRCVVSGHLDKAEHYRAHRRGTALPGSFGVITQAAHIIPHSLNSVRVAGDPLPAEKNFVWSILNMFDPGITATLEGPLIDTPANALMLFTELHDEFGRLRIWLEEVAVNTYVLRKARRAAMLAPTAAPLERIVMRNHEPAGKRWADLPSARLLKLHAACAKMMEMAGAGEWVDDALETLDRMEGGGTLAADGSSDVVMLLRCRGLGIDTVAGAMVYTGNVEVKLE